MKHRCPLCSKLTGCLTKVCSDCKRRRQNDRVRARIDAELRETNAWGITSDAGSIRLELL